RDIRNNNGFRCRSFLCIVSAPYADFLTTLRTIGFINFLYREVQSASNMVVVLLAVAAYRCFQLLAVEERKEIGLFFFIVDGYFKNVLIRHVNFIVESLFAVLLHGHEDFSKDVLRADVSRCAEEPFIPASERTIDLLKQVH